MAGCGSTAAKLLKAASAPIILVWRPWYNFPNGQGSAASSLMYQGIAPWLRANPGVRVRLTTLGYQRDTVSSMVAGTGPDVFEDWVLPIYVQANLALDLTPYVRRDAVDLGLFSSPVMDYIQATGRYAPGGPGLYGVPAYTHTLALAVNEGLLGQLGLRLPEPDWTYAEWTALWESATRRSTDPARQRYGGQLYWSGYDYTTGNPAPFYLHGFGGEYVDPQHTTRCALDEQGSVQCLTWAYGLLLDGVVGGNGLSDFTANRQATALVDTAGSLSASASAWQSLRWNLYPMPRWPLGRATFASSDFYGVWAGTAYPDVAWDFVRFLCVDPGWQRWMMKLALVGPNQPRLFPEWAQVVRAVAPPLRAKSLDVITAEVAQGTPYVGSSFRYEEEASAGVISRYSSLAQSGHLSVEAAARQATRQVNALQAGGAAAEARSVALVQEIERVALSPTPLVLPAPSPNSGGVVAKPSPYALLTRGRWKVLGDGSACGGTADNAILLAAAATHTRARFVCRIVSLANVSGPQLSPLSQAGLMVRGDLGDDAPMVSLAVTGANGLLLAARPVAGEQAAAYGPPETASPAGLIGAPFLTRSLDVWSPNYLLAPVWLRIDRDGVRWTAYSSLDGRVWQQAGATQVVEIAAAWVGVYVCAHNVDFGSRYYASASFDRMSFRPSTAYQIGGSGVVPGAGPVPPGWASD